MVKQNKISLVGKIIVIAAAVLSIVMVSGTWLDLYQVPMIFGDSIPHKYSLHDIADLLDTFNMYLNNADVDFYASLFAAGATVIVIVNVILMIAALLHRGTARIAAVVSLLAAIIITGVFFSAVRHINAEMKEVTYGGIKELLRSTSNPSWLIVFSILANVGCCFKQKEKKLDAVSNVYGNTQTCLQCGAAVVPGAAFCNACGAKTEISVNNSTNTKFCTSCGAKIPENAAFCTECGGKTE